MGKTKSIEYILDGKYREEVDKNGKMCLKTVVWLQRNTTMKLCARDIMRNLGMTLERSR
eukprot:TRINITY_DN8086_c0_g1_i1.p1 TRINITY_DN8086_c0_g1~~TRINITY_DN8086_c0_g1_i1.p1  ORF type:complete len:59 (-),score=13.21 TRINITY_DN8086_c0_g1_i1:149-325(-)